MTHHPAKIAFFDFDGTLIKTDSFIGFSRFAVGNSKFILSLLKTLPYIVLWKLGLKEGGWAKQKLFSRLFRGMPLNIWKEKCRAYADHLNKDENPGMIEILNGHQEKGHSTVIVTASIRDWVIPWAAGKNIDDVIATEIEINDSGCLTGKFSTPNCYGREKVTRIKAAYLDISRIETWGYGDSSSDRYLTEFTTHGRII